MNVIEEISDEERAGRPQGPDPTEPRDLAAELEALQADLAAALALLNGE